MTSSTEFECPVCGEVFDDGITAGQHEIDHRDITNGNLTSLTDTELADYYAEAARVAGSDPDSDEKIMFADNEIIGRLNIDPDETEQGLTERAQTMIDGFVAENQSR